MKLIGAAAAVALSANDVSAAYVAWMIVGAVLLVVAVAVLARLVSRMVRGRVLGVVWPAYLIGVLVAGWCAVGWPAGWMGG